MKWQEPLLNMSQRMMRITMSAYYRTVHMITSVSKSSLLRGYRRPLLVHRYFHEIRFSCKALYSVAISHYWSIWDVWYFIFIVEY